SPPSSPDVVRFSFVLLALRSSLVPLYEYQCTRCSHRFEKIEKVSGPHAKKCPKCAGKVERLMAPPAIQFKGTGWHVTDYARGQASSGDAKGAKPEKTEKAKKESKKATPAKETKEGKKEKAKKET